MTFFFWSMRNYMILGTVFMIVAGYVNTGQYDKHGFAGLPFYAITIGPIIVVVCALICMLTSFTIQAVIDYFIQPGSK
jgi:hypothetical protein